MPETQTSEGGLKVVIVGAGTSGLMLALLLELCGIDYVLLEKKSEFRPHSRACILCAVIIPIFEQIGLLREIEDISLPARKFKIKKQNNPQPIGEIEGSYLEAKYGYPLLVMPRPALYNILLSKIPKHKILLGKRVLSTSQSELGILVRCADGSTYSGDILVGSDGANSSVRQNLYRQLEALTPGPTSILPPLSLSVPGNDSDEKSRLDWSWCIVGITNPLDRDQYAELGQPYSDFVAVMGHKNKEVVWFIPAANRRLMWVAITPIEKSDKTLCDDGFMASELGPEAIEEMCSRYQDFDCPFGGSMKDIFDQSPPHLMSRILVQEMIFDKWCGGRTVLLGNACHKFPMSAGLNDSVNLAESVALVNQLHEIRSNSVQEIRAAFEQYQAEREPQARRALQFSKQLHSFFSERGIMAFISRKVSIHRTAEVAWSKTNDFLHKNRPQATFLPMIPQRGEFKRQDPVPSSVPRRVRKFE
ncbi:hypothetical protein BGZ65_003507 [Modicella reniformis]|uniref:FAD-binding domain-containing protein n=1 Tax=Modicella reniformis TaxID=1440133 RepID=A0A9P6MII7_9FUNG|nr:hypothetical protein BGZ65_003507 [Modicella reniformis]